MRLTDFTYDLPKELIAQEPARPRDHARLMLINRQSEEISHHHIYNLPNLLPLNYFIVANNTKVFPARIAGHKSTGGAVEILLLSPLGQSRYKCIAKPGLKKGQIIHFEEGLEATVIEISDNVERIVAFNQDESQLRTTLSQIGSMPTPPYIKKLLGDSSDYQTVYAKYGFSAAAPTAGLHFTDELLNRIKNDHSWEEITLNVGLGTFLPVKEEAVESHQMHEESYEINEQTAIAIKKHKASGQKLLSIGTTTMRALESNPTLTPGNKNTSIFIYPPYQFQLTDALLTNFHLPESTLLMLVSAFCTKPNTPKPFSTFADSLLGRAYQVAIKEKYRFFSFGDAMLIL